jgi:hypothetical protein
MPYIDYYLGTDIHLTKEDISNGLPRELTPKLNLGKDNRTWKQTHLTALTLILCNLVTLHKEDDGKFLYSRKKRQIPKQFNPNGVSYSSLFFVIDTLVEGKVLEGYIAPPRTTGVNPKLLSEFTVTQQALDFAYALGINRQTVKVLDNFHVRLRNHKPPNEPLEFKQNSYTGYVEMLMSKYNHYLNQQSIMLKTDDETGEGIVEYGTKLKGQKIHLYRNYKNWSEDKDVAKDFESLLPFIKLSNPNFAFGGRGGSYWQNDKKEDRPTILINGNKTGTADFPCSHINLCYKHETKNWYQLEPNSELVEQGRGDEDAYMVHPKLPRDVPKMMVQMMLNIKGRTSVSKTFNDWILRRNTKLVPINPKPKSLLAKTHNKVIDEDNVASKELSALYKKTGLEALDVMTAIEEKHQPIKDYFYKGKLAGQIIQWEEANLIFNLAWEFCSVHDIPTLTVHDELIAEVKHIPMIREFMYSSGYSEVCNKYSLMNKIKGM